MPLSKGNDLVEWRESTFYFSVAGNSSVENDFCIFELVSLVYVMNLGYMNCNIQWTFSIRKKYQHI